MEGAFPLPNHPCKLKFHKTNFFPLRGRGEKNEPEAVQPLEETKWNR
jgi:hypothetical protein